MPVARLRRCSQASCGMRRCPPWQRPRQRCLRSLLLCCSCWSLLPPGVRQRAVMHAELRVMQQTCSGYVQPDQGTSQMPAFGFEPVLVWSCTQSAGAFRATGGGAPRSAGPRAAQRSLSRRDCHLWLRRVLGPATQCAGRVPQCGRAHCAGRSLPVCRWQQRQRSR